MHFLLHVIANKSGINFNLFLNNHIKTVRELSHHRGLAKQPVLSLILGMKSGEAVSPGLIRECFLQICGAVSEKVNPVPLQQPNVSLSTPEWQFPLGKLDLFCNLFHYICHLGQ